MIKKLQDYTQHHHHYRADARFTLLKYQQQNGESENARQYSDLDQIKSCQKENLQKMQKI